METSTTRCLYGLALGLLFLPSAAFGEDIPKSDLSQLGATGVIKEVCSAVFLSKRDEEEFLAHSSKFWMTPEDKSTIETVDIDHESQTATLRLANGTEATAVFTGPQGCVALAPGEEKVGFTPVSAPSALPAADTQVWPMGNLPKEQEWPKELDRAGVAKAIEQAFTPDAHTAAFIVLYKGNIVAERYGEGVTAETLLPGWSITKTLQATWVGRLEAEGRLTLTDKSVLPEWSEAGDPRRDITLADLLSMSSGIACGQDSSEFDYDGWRKDGYIDYLYVFVGPDDSYDYAVSRPIAEMPGERGVYTNCQPHAVGQILTNELEKTDDSLFVWPQKALYDYIGIRSMVVEPDRQGNLLTAAYSYATARDWARLGLLYAQDGVWNGERLLSPEFMSFVRTPSPAWSEPVYGGQLWLYKQDGGSWPNNEYWPEDTFSMEGIEGQSIIIAPSLDLVVVRLGHGIGDDPSIDYGEEGTPAFRSIKELAQTLRHAVGK